MVIRFTFILVVLGCDDGPVDIYDPPDVRTTSSIHRSIPGVDYSDSLFFAGRKYPAPTLSIIVLKPNLTSFAARF